MTALTFLKILISQLLAKPGFFLNAPDYLKYGLIGLGAFLAVLTFVLLNYQMRRNKSTKPVYIFMVFSCLIMILGLLSENASALIKTIVPEQKTLLVDSLPPSSDDAYSIVKDIMIFDLRAWQLVDSSKNVKQSPVNVLNYLHVKKDYATDSITAHYSTSGLGIDLRCVTHNYKIYEEKHRSHNGGKSYGISIDVSEMPINTEFLILIEATYWNGFKSADFADASTYTDDDITSIQDLSLIVLLPKDKPVKGIPSAWKEKEGIKSLVRNGPFTDPNKHYMYWPITPIQAHTHYTIEWQW